jgi:hypothetical protein
MHNTRRVFLGVLVVGLACSDGNAPPVPTGIVVASGNSQQGLPGLTLAQPLRVTVTGAGGSPYPDVVVTWSVTTGSATFSSPTSRTNASGEASTNVTVGLIPGSLVVRASVPGGLAVTFTLTALDPCTFRVVLPGDTTANGVLTNFDCQFPAGQPFFTDFYSVALPAQAGLQISMSAPAFDTYLDQRHVIGSNIAVNDDLDSSSNNSRIQIIAGAGTYVFAASTFIGGVTGPYTLTVAPRAQTLTGCRGEYRFLPWITRGVAFSDQVLATDCVTARGAAGTAYSDKVLIVLTPVRTLSATLTSTAFNPRLDLYEETVTGLVFRDRGVESGGTSTLNYIPDMGRVFLLEITSVDSVKTGAYTLTVGGPTPNAAEVIALPFGQVPIRSRATPGKARPN